MVVLSGTATVAIAGGAELAAAGVLAPPCTLLAHRNLPRPRAVPSYPRHRRSVAEPRLRPAAAAKPLPCVLARVARGPRTATGHAAGGHRCALPPRSSRAAPPPPSSRRPAFPLAGDRLPCSAGLRKRTAIPSLCLSLCLSGKRAQQLSGSHLSV
jgi:hypothetical protein